MTAYLGLGSNMGDRAANLRNAVRLLSEESVTITARSRIYETLPVGDTSQERFYNAAIGVETGTTPRALLDRCLEIETMMGRVRTARRGPRIIDIDILMCDGAVIDAEQLTVPHPRMHERAFVLKPLADIAPDAVHPILDLSIGDLLERADTSGICGIVGNL